MPRLFIAVWPPPDVVEQVAALPRPPVAGLRWTEPEQWHVTLRFLGALGTYVTGLLLVAAMLVAR